MLILKDRQTLKEILKIEENRIIWAILSHQKKASFQE